MLEIEVDEILERLNERITKAEYNLKEITKTEDIIRQYFRKEENYIFQFGAYFPRKKKLRKEFKDLYKFFNGTIPWYVLDVITKRGSNVDDTELTYRQLKVDRYMGELQNKIKDLNSRREYYQTVFKSGVYGNKLIELSFDDHSKIFTNDVYEDLYL